MMIKNKIEILAINFLYSKINADGTYRKDFLFSKHNKILEKIFNEKNKNLFEKIILADKVTMEKYIQKYKIYLLNNNLEFKSIEALSKANKRNKTLKALLELYKSYSSFSKNWNYQIIQAIGVKTCLYCNRESILSFSKSNGSSISTTAEIDHFYPRSLYPFLSISFFNLIPSCKTCNSKFKGDIDTALKNKEILYPYEDDFNLKAKFTHFFENTNDNNKDFAILSEKRISLKIEPIKTSDLKTKNTIKTFELENLYNEHKDTVLELIQKREIYSDTYIEELLEQYGGTLFKNKEDLLRLITCGYVNDEDLDKRSLSKLIKDISQELDLI